MLNAQTKSYRFRNVTFFDFEFWPIQLCSLMLFTISLHPMARILNGPPYGK